MHLFLTIVAFIVIFSVLILIHEAGHFFAAKRAGVKVEEFGFGMPPRLFGVKRGETLYSVNWIPFGGFVRLLGQDDSSKEAQASKRSYSNKSLRVQAWIVCAGVVMNLLLSFVLLTVGFWVGIEPLIATEDDFMQGIREGTVDLAPGIVVVESTAPQLNVGDRLMGFESIEEWQSVIGLIEKGEMDQSSIPIVSISRSDGTEGAGVLLTADLLKQVTFAPLYVPRLVYQDSPHSVFHGLLQTGDVLLNLEGNEIFTADDLNNALQNMHGGCLIASVYRPSQRTAMGSVLSGTSCLTFPEQHPVITMVVPDSPAESAGLVAGDQILTVQGVDATSAEQVVSLTQVASDVMAYTIQHADGSDPQNYSIPLGADGRVGVSLADPVAYYHDFSLYPTYVPETLMGTDKVQYGWNAPVVAVQEMWRLGKMTAGMFVHVLKQFVTAQGVPEGVSGPVGIAQMTGVTLEQGWAAMLRFVALLSLSLGVINILPFPALDGGHFALILFKGITGKKDNPKWERVINLGGFLFLISFILFITFNDVMNLF